MFRRRGCALLCEWVAEVNRERVARSSQFATMDGWQAGEDSQFDQFVAKKRLQDRFEEMDQRVSRAFNVVVKAHKVEVINAFKRRLRNGGEKLTHDTMREMNEAVEERTAWLRDVWHQIDADYRSGDAERETRAAGQIAAALRGEPGDYIAWAYEKKRERRFLGPKGQEAFDTEYENANMPNISEDEANRYHNLQTNMSALEQAVAGKFGAAGERHWELLQREKDAEYVAKLDEASEKYKMLMQQEVAYDESMATEETRNRIQRVERAKVRFKTAMEIEEERLRMVEAHEAMKRERREAEIRRHRDELKRAAELRAEGKTSAEVATMLKMERLGEVAERQAMRARAEQEEVTAKRRKYLALIDELERESEVRQGRDAMVSAGATSSSSSSVGAAHATRTAGSVAEQIRAAANLAAERGESSLAGSKQALWDVINADQWEDPRRTVHQARVDARKTHDEIYRMTDPTRMRLGPGMANRGHGAFIQNHQERFMLQNPEVERMTFHWGPTDQDQHNLDDDGRTQYVQSNHFGISRMDPRTGDIDYRFERKNKGGAIFTGPRLYKMGERDNNQPPIVPMPKKRPQDPKTKHPYMHY